MTEKMNLEKALELIKNLPHWDRKGDTVIVGGMVGYAPISLEEKESLLKFLKVQSEEREFYMSLVIYLVIIGSLLLVKSLLG